MDAVSSATIVVMVVAVALVVVLVALLVIFCMLTSRCKVSYIALTSVSSKDSKCLGTVQVMMIY